MHSCIERVVAIIGIDWRLDDVDGSVLGALSIENGKYCGEVVTLLSM